MKRSQIQLLIDILDNIKEPISITHLQYKIRVNRYQIDRYILFCYRKGFMNYNNKKLIITEKGRQLLEFLK